MWREHHQSGPTRTLVEAVEWNRDEGDQRGITGNGGRKRDRKQMRRGRVDAMERGYELCLCDMRYNEESRGRGMGGKTTRASRTLASQNLPKTKLWRLALILLRNSSVLQTTRTVRGERYWWVLDG